MSNAPGAVNRHIATNLKVDAAAAGLDEGRLARIGEHFRSRYLDSGKIAGAQVAVVRGGVLGYFENFGFQDRERNVAVADDAIWRLYSMTKPITGVAMMSLYEHGHFQLDDPIERWIPEWRNLTVEVPTADGGTQIVPANRPPTVKDILTHTSGIGYGERNKDLVIGERNWLAGHDLESMSKVFSQWPLRFQPGTKWLYSHGMDVAARLVEIMSGMPYDEYLRTQLFEPLGMTDTDFWVPEAKAGRLAANYARNGRKELVLLEDPRHSVYLSRPKLLNGGGGLVGTMHDYLRFATMLANGGEIDGRRLLSRKTVELMTSNHLAGNGEMSQFAIPNGYGEVGFAGNGFGLTVAVSKGPGATGVVGSAGEFMWGGAASTTFWVDPSEELAVVFMTQLMPSGTFNFRGQLKTLVYGALT